MILLKKVLIGRRGNEILQINSHYNQGRVAWIALYIQRQFLEDDVELYVRISCRLFATKSLRNED